jgi:hypothetical protein
MSLAESFAERLSFKKYSSGVITAGSEPVASVSPGASGGQVLRHVSHNITLAKDAYASTEKRTDRQRPMGRHGTKRAPGTINGLLSPLTYESLFEAALRGTWSTAAISHSQSSLTSVSASNVAATFTFTGGDPVALGFRVGDIIRFTGMLDTDNNSKNFLILGFSGASNRVVNVYPAPDTQTGDTSFTVATAGRSLFIPSSAHVSRLYAFEANNPDIDLATLFTECRIGGFNLAVTPNNNITVAFPVLGRNRTTLVNTNAPFFTAPTAETTTDLCAAVDGVLRLNGEVRGVVTDLSINLTLNPQGPPVIGTNLVPEIFLSDAAITGQFSVFLEDGDFLDALDLESEFDINALYKTSSAAASPAMSFHLPRVKINTNEMQDDPSGGKLIRCSYDAARYFGALPGVESTALRISDSEK